MNAYIYIVFRPDGRPCYVGKGTGQRWKRHDCRAKSNPHYKAILDLAGESLPVVIISSGLTDKRAYELEGLLTQAIGLEKDGGPLVNCGHGGQGGPSGVVRSDEWKKTRSLRAKEVWERKEYREKTLRSDRNRSGNKQTRSDEFKKAMSARLIGNTHTLGFKHSDEARAKISASRKGVPKSPEHRAAMAEAAKRGWIKRKARA